MKFQDVISNMNTHTHTHTHTHTDKPKPICPSLFQSWRHKYITIKGNICLISLVTKIINSVSIASTPCYFITMVTNRRRTKVFKIHTKLHMS